MTLSTEWCFDFYLLQDDMEPADYSTKTVFSCTSLQSPSYQVETEKWLL